MPATLNVAIFGMGSGRTAGRAAQRLVASTIGVPVIVESSHAAPASVGADSLVLALSGSGNTDEVNHAAAQAVERGARLVAVSSPGWLCDFARDRGAPLVRIPEAIAPARAAFGFMAGAILSILARTGLAPDARTWIAPAAGALRAGRETAEKRARDLAPKLAAHHVTFQGDSTIGGVAAERWKAQFNQNARLSASFSEQPNAGHNEVVSWDALDGDLAGAEAVVLLRHPFEDPRVARRIDQFAEYLADKAQSHQVRVEGDHTLTALMALAMLADFTSLAVADLRGIDPATIPFISATLKEGIVAPAYGKARG